MSRSSSLDFSQAYKIPALEISISMLEFPQCGIRGAIMKHVINYTQRLAGMHLKLHGSFEPLWNPYMFNCRTKEETLVCLKYWLPHYQYLCSYIVIYYGLAYLRTFENSLVGDTTKLSLDDDHDMRCCILTSSSMLVEELEFTLTIKYFKIGLTCRVYGWKLFELLAVEY